MSLPAARIGDSLVDGDHIASGASSVFINNIPAVRLGDITTGEGCFPSAVIISGSSSVFCENLPLVRVSDQRAVHCCPDNGCHSAIVSQGSSDVFAG